MGAKKPLIDTSELHKAPRPNNLKDSHTGPMLGRDLKEKEGSVLCVIYRNYTCINIQQLSSIP